MWRSLRTIRSFPRIKDIAIILGKHGFHQVAGSLQAPFTTTLRRLFRRQPGPVVQQPERLRMALEDLGPTFIKFGQLLSTRPDLLPTEYIEELGKLQDDVRPAPFEEIVALLDEEFQTDSRKLFSRIDSEPLASASIAQVHRATTLNGDEVVVKVRKKGLERLVQQDLQVLSLLAEFLAGWRGLRLFDPEGVVRWFERSLQRELNFDYERYNLLRIRESIPKGSKICVPRVYPQLSRRGVLTMEYFAGEKLTLMRTQSLDPERGREISTSVALFILKQIFEHGMYHADPHPGNLIILPDGKIGLLDFGNVGRFTREMKEDLLHVLTALIRRNYRDVSRWVLKRGQAPNGVDLHGLALELMDTLDPYYGLSLEEIQLGGLFNSIFAIALRHGISMPAPYVHAGRTFVILEGVVRLCSPQMALIPAIRPYMAEVLKKRWAPGRLLRDLEGDVSELFTALRSCPTNLAEVLGRAAEGRFRMESDIPQLDKLGEKADQASNRIQLAVLASGLLISSAILLSQRSPDTWSLPEALGVGGFVSALLLMLKLLFRG